MSLRRVFPPRQPPSCTFWPTCAASLGSLQNRGKWISKEPHRRYLPAFLVARAAKGFSTMYSVLESQDWTVKLEGSLSK